MVDNINSGVGDIMSSRPSGVALGPVPTSARDDELMGLVMNVSSMFSSSMRKRRSLERYLIHEEDFKRLIIDRLKDVHSDAETIAEMSKFVDLSINPGLDIAKSVSVVWKHGARRSVEGVSAAANEAILSLVEESMLAVHAPLWNRLAFLTGPVTVVPVVRGGEMGWDVLLPHFYDVVPDRSRPYGPPAAAAWTVNGVDDVDTVLLDGNSWRYYRTSGGKPELVTTEEHGIGRFPGATLRFDITYDSTYDPWWGSPRNQRLVDGTVMIGLINAGLAFTRKAQNKKLLTAIGDLTGMPKQQKLDPVIPVVINTDRGPGSVSMTALDFDTNPQNFIQHALWVLQSLAEAYGAQTPPMATGATISGYASRFSFTHDALTEIRNEQIPFARAFERDLMRATISMAKAMKHRVALDLPTIEQFDEGFRVEFPKLARTFADPTKEAEFSDWLIRRGCMTQIDILRSQNPTLSDRQLAALMDANLRSQAEFNDKVTSRGLIHDNSNNSITTAPQVTGAIGGKARADKAQDQAENNEE